MFGLVCQAQSDNKYPCDKIDLKKIRIAILDYVIKNSIFSANEISLTSEQCVSSYASATVHPIKPVTDDSIIYLRLVNNQWTVVGMGTSFDDAFLAKIPKALRIK